MTYDKGEVDFEPDVFARDNCREARKAASSVIAPSQKQRASSDPSDRHGNILLLPVRDPEET
ncbi:MAG: hypothetical protein EOR30_26140 [Mesorhizobium sp.]|uniref:hypothetical protein n=1 Tax=Mesorhizobium sp. TaxID=1871066 RepID=UPI000FE9F488|nr:hypothetical protein [Mesorhizobium sp.]RWI63286.1 MAG: hypothetical protein EOR17_29420 [Mesorhizobium sp.]RWI82560.1 MAG: hypothetical protein EOR20_27075 [Mesorhizobium sp.]RWJ46737.1 MAG: hypothetical protein EOR30_26140 [Mesorhizobium sp.]RWJ57492.1 MAG: hypothetical protein EOR32_29380 [Mesorhizobium sp.]RWJ96225.1 MAG: hypothetical protein EOR38_25885 [Mesorhizobium sp.]